jgi:UDP-N-acetylmuramyl pentapeptide phosphotransferase/UDP-N-acetylglucosamine-1-phosphate transferase
MLLTFGMRAHHAHALTIFGGDAGALVLGTLLMATIYVAPGSALHRGWLRWGFLAIGAFAFMDTFADWWHAAHGSEGVVFGENVGVGDTDPTRLVFEHGWSEARLVARYLTLSWSCLSLLATLYLVNLRRSLGRRASSARL